MKSAVNFLPVFHGFTHNLTNKTSTSYVYFPLIVEISFFMKAIDGKMKEIVVLRKVMSEVFFLGGKSDKIETVYLLADYMEEVRPVYGKRVIKPHVTKLQGQTIIIREAMMQGYLEMSHINLSICSECLHAEYEAQDTTERLVSGG